MNTPTTPAAARPATAPICCAPSSTPSPRPAPAVFASINDAAVVDQARHAGVGATISISLGGKQGVSRGEPLRVNAYVKAITDGRFINRAGSMFEGVRFDLGAMCRLVIQGVDVIVASRAEQIYDEEPFFLHGIDVRVQAHRHQGANHFRAGYRRLAAQIISVDSVGLSTADITSFPRERLVGEYWPLPDRAALEDKQGLTPSGTDIRSRSASARLVSESSRSAIIHQSLNAGSRNILGHQASVFLRVAHIADKEPRGPRS